MGRLGRGIIWLALIAIAMLAVLSVVGAFYGAEKAGQFFNSTPLKIYWGILAFLLIAGLVRFPALIRQPPLLLMHAGCLLVVLGAMFGSQAGHEFARRFLHINKIPGGYMVIAEGQSENRVVDDDFNPVSGPLPFGIRLNDFRLEYYEPDPKTGPQLMITTQDGRQFQIAAQVGQAVSFNPAKGSLRVTRTFDNFKIRIENGRKIVSDEKGSGQNPATEVEIEKPDGSTSKCYVFERIAAHLQNFDGLQIHYAPQRPQMIRDYFSDISVIQNGKEIAKKTIEVNHPLRYGGYHFYQHSYDSKAGQFTVLAVTSDSGLYAVYAGFWLLGLGTLWQFWFGPASRYIKHRQNMKASVQWK